jgi:hypothetical protein
MARISANVIFWRASFGMSHDRADLAESEAAGYWAFAARPHYGRGTGLGISIFGARESRLGATLTRCPVLLNFPNADMVLKRNKARRRAVARSAEKER